MIPGLIFNVELFYFLLYTFTHTQTSSLADVAQMSNIFCFASDSGRDVNCR